ncbi:succinate dehydrogenase flavoprotein subunit SdhA [Paenibacillus larvae subsp. larvae]|uniref:L-aspartate oxidase n=1 Tax=Paenibacillus larvae subsp. larvae TaxID=147375 RepID=A0A2L1U8L7_9BACL|nr:L-aspartate oxidase [Paenibacillus larvae]AQT86830.1 L-aspartate oxidase [Paenibacillus larvae subsp. pulvifaciens]AQZ47197.1 L-aspartate oxidase [Paenibacillus larvae subsp. pulvifaciens]AVF24490.1 succinate dehydrogenase flavoprotein subunit SdhA [Paenibacillus larvae subsp. larvae]AVF29251.1 succinate dehydrogenase flavoprotein subunit SdhA [Paenibacillus larvae subsp. larvae]MBH0344171.1 aspartate oxidase [Paenibacillus larvae]
MIPRYLTDFNLSVIPWVQTDVMVIGAGIAGLYAAIQASESKNVLLITKKSLLDSNTRYAQGGIAAVVSSEDSPEYHLQDTLFAGAGLCSREAVDILVNEGPEGIQELIRLGTQFDEENGELSLTREGAHSQRRILHAHGDATGAEIIRALSEKARQIPYIELWDAHFVIDLVTREGICYGALVQKPDGTKVFVKAEATVLCSGGAGQLYRYTTNPDIATGDGIGMAYRAGAEIRDMEFIQFHPTALCYPGAPRFLISEAVRGEGAYLRNTRGERFMNFYHPQLELAPRDVVARAIVNEMERTNSTFVYLDITHMSESFIRQRFPSIYETCIHYGLDLTSDWIPVAPAAHYMMGGVKTDIYGETTVKRLFACGEVSSTGVHGANRLASNSLSEAIVFGRRIVSRIKEYSALPDFSPMEIRERRREAPRQPMVERRLKLQKIMVRYVGVTRSQAGLLRALEELRRQLPIFESSLTKREEYEFANLLTCALLTAQAALEREESRGGHFRGDYPESHDDTWIKHISFIRKEAVEECFPNV